MSRVQVRLVAATAAEVAAAADAVAGALQVEHRSRPRPRRDGGVAVYLQARLLTTVAEHDQDHEHDQDREHDGSEGEP